MTLKSVLLAELGKIAQGITLSRYANDKDGSLFQVISISDLENLYVHQVEGQAKLNVSELGRYELLADDVVIAIRGSILKSSVITDALKGSVSNQNTVFFRAKSDAIDPLYLAVLLRSGYFERLPSLWERQSTTTLSSIKVSDVRLLEIPLPDLYIQKQIGQLFLSVEERNKKRLSTIESHQRIAKGALFKELGIL